MVTKLTYDKLPVEIQERMLLEQEEQGNERDPEVFRKFLSADADHKGFDWKKTNDGYSFWLSILTSKDFDCFFKQYPKEDAKTYPRIMEVSNSKNFSLPVTRVVFMEKNGKYIAWSRAETFEEAEGILRTTYWGYAREVTPIVELTAEDISAGKGVGIDPKLIRFKE